MRSTRAIADRADPSTAENRHLRAQFERNHPELASGAVHAQGRYARAAGAPLEACPWIGSERDEWRRGWHGLPARSAGTPIDRPDTPP